jgi:3',5'-cyclic AMP phosphodiesterase CpdA
MRIAWATDIHLEFLTPPALTTFCITLARSTAEAFLISGDISQARRLPSHLRILERTVERPVYFVLGNHDFYHGKIAEVREHVREISGISSYLRWLPATGPIGLSADTGLLGHDGWADGRLGDYRHSPVLLNDYRLIEDFVGLDPAARLALLHRLGDEAAAYLRRELPAALTRWKRLVVLTHVPPFAEAAWHLGRQSDKDWLPHFSCQATGDALLEAAAAHPDREIRVLCGHTHSAGEVNLLPNLRVTTGGARYGAPAIQSEWVED